MALSQIQQQLLDAVRNQLNPNEGKTVAQLTKQINYPYSSRGNLYPHLFYLKRLGLISQDWAVISNRRCYLWFPKSKN